MPVEIERKIEKNLREQYPKKSSEQIDRIKFAIMNKLGYLKKNMSSVELTECENEAVENAIFNMMKELS